MPPDGIVTVGTQVNIAPLVGGMAEAKAAVKAATASMAEAQAAFGKAAEQGSEQAKAALAQYRGELEAAQAALAQFTGSQDRANNSVRASYSSYREARYALEGMSGSAYGAEGAIALMLSRMTGGSAIVASLFDIALPVAFAEIIGTVGKEVYNLYENFVSLDGVEQQFAEHVRELQAKDFIDVHSLETANLRLKEATESARQLASAAETLHGSWIKDLLSGNVGAAVSDIAGAHAANTSQVQSQTQQIALQLKQNQLQHQVNLQKIETAHAADAELQGEQRINAELQKKLDINKENYEYRQLQDRTMGNITPKDAGKMLLDLQNQQAQGEAAAQRAMLGENEPADIGIGKKSKVQAEQAQLAKAANASAAQDQRELDAMTESISRMQQRQAQDFTRSIEQWKRYDEEVAKSSQIQAQNRFAIEEAALHFQVATGRISELDAAQHLATIHAAEYAEELEALNRQLAEIQRNDLLTPAQKATQTQGVQNQIEQVQGKAGSAKIQDQSRIAETFAAPWKRAFNTMDLEFNSSINEWLRGTQRFSEAFTRMADDMAIHFTDSLLKQGEQWVQHEAMKLIVHEMTNAGIMTQDQAAAMVSTATSAQSTLTQITHYAALAAAKAYSALAGIPIVGPALGAVAAGATFIAVEALAAFDTGTSYIPRDGVAMLHRGETVLPPPQTEALNRALSGGARSSPEIHFHHSTNVNAIDGPSVATALSNHAQAFQREQYKQLRKMNLVQ